jgi:peptide/nickel transport system permease protein
MGAPPRGRARRAWAFVRRPGNFQIIFGLGGPLLIWALCLFYPTPFDPIKPNTNIGIAGPNAHHLFGTDELGRDIFSRMLDAGRTDIPLVLAAALLATVTGIIIGLAVSARSPWSERVMRVLDLFQAFPAYVLLIVLIVVAGNSLSILMLVIALIYGPGFARQIRAEALAIRESRFIEAAISIGSSTRRLLVRHVLPNVTGIIVVNFALTAAQGLIILAALSFLGFGVQPPTPDWGAMISDGSQYLADGDWWMFLWPGIIIVVLGFFFYHLHLGLDTVLGRGSRG